MTDNLIKIDSGSITVPVQVDDNPVVNITFNPNDDMFAKRLHKFYFDVKEKLIEMNTKQTELDESGTDENGMPMEIDAVMQEYRDMNLWLRERIDLLLGEGTSQKIYGDTIYTGERIDVYIQLFDGLFRLAAPAREAKVKPYIRKK